MQVHPINTELKKTIPGLVLDALAKPRDRAFAERRFGTDFTFLSTSEMRDRIAAIACALRDRGLQPGDRVALIANSSLDWIAVDMGILATGCVCVPIFVTSAADQLAYILADSEPKLIFVETPEEATRIGALAPRGTHIMHFEGEGAGGLAIFQTYGAALHAADPKRFAEMCNAIAPDDLAVLIYTSGTTGEPKGVMLTQHNIVSNAVDAWTYALLGIPSDGVGLSVLPYAHIMEHTNMIGFIFSGLMYYVTLPERFLADLLVARPHVVCIVPRILERVLMGILTRARAGGGVRAKLVPWALEVGRRYSEKLVKGAPLAFPLRLEYAVARRLVLRRIPPALGLDRLSYFASGSAPLHRDIALTFAGIGLPVCEGYGLTETSPVVSVNRITDNRYGTVGKPIPHVEVSIADDGEILVRGPNVMKGYFRRDDAPFTLDGRLRTGDLGTLDADGYLTITDRKHELFKTSGGKFIAPTRLETAVKRSVYVNQVMVVGASRPYPLALVVPNWPLVRTELKLGEELSGDVLAARADVREFMRREVFWQTKELALFEQVRVVVLLARELTMEDGEISPTMKIRRRVVERRYGELIDKAYARGV
jgi:long-chain acyl-CoA synthetase